MGSIVRQHMLIAQVVLENLIENVIVHYRAEVIQGDQANQK